MRGNRYKHHSVKKFSQIDHPEALKEDLPYPPYKLTSQESPTFESYAYAIITDAAYKRVMLSRDEETGIYSAKYIPKITNSALIKGRHIDRHGKANIPEYICRRFNEIYLGIDMHESFIVGDHAVVDRELTEKTTEVCTTYNLLINDIALVQYTGVQDTVFSLQGIEGHRFMKSRVEKVPELLEYAEFIEESALEAIKFFVRQHILSKVKK